MTRRRFRNKISPQGEKKKEKKKLKNKKHRGWASYLCSCLPRYKGQNKIEDDDTYMPPSVPCRQTEKKGHTVQTERAENIEDAAQIASHETKETIQRENTEVQKCFTEEAETHVNSQEVENFSKDVDEHEETTDSESNDSDGANYFPPIQTSKTGLTGWLLDKRIHQFSISPLCEKQKMGLFSGYNGIMSCAINHILLADLYYKRHWQDGSIFYSNDEIDYITKKVYSTIAKGNQIHIENFGRSDFLEATEALSVLRNKGYCPELRWNEMSPVEIAMAESMGVEVEGDLLPASFDLEITAPTSDESSLAKHVSALNADNKEALMYVFEGSFFLFVPTEDGRVLLFDVHPHFSLNGGAIILASPQNKEDIQLMLDKYHTEHFFSSSYTLGQGTIFCIEL